MSQLLVVRNEVWCSWVLWLGILQKKVKVWSQVAPCPLPCGPLNRAAHSMAVCFPRVSKTEVRVLRNLVSLSNTPSIFCIVFLEADH